MTEPTSGPKKTRGAESADARILRAKRRMIDGIPGTKNDVLAALNGSAGTTIVAAISFSPEAMEKEAERREDVAAVLRILGPLTPEARKTFIGIATATPEDAPGGAEAGS